ncbi:hypothetical protein C1645_747624 [Glomus cerebriforme]|uniref:Uncharacterized protein n=1 Tax=Glomus cerebriforme TaxID=658196 RepID=A0A397TLW7_9GLOM|nr:hypothetical protein C1645_747624 [Glomus cerebriforme]
MDGERDLQRNQFNGSKMRRTRSLQHVFPSLQNQRRNLSRRSRSTPNFNGKNTRVYEEKEARNEKVYEAIDIFTQTFGSDRKLDKHLTTYKQRGYVPDNHKRFLESQSQTDSCSIIRNINSGKTPTQKTYDRTSTEGRSDKFPSTYSSSKSESRSDAKGREMGSCQLRRDEYMDASKSSEAQYTNSDSHNRRRRRNSKVSLPKLQDVPYQLFDQLKDELHDFTEKDQRFLDVSLRGHLAKTFGITQIFPLYLDRSEFVMWFLDENKCLFQWNKMENSVIYMGPDLEEGIKNYLIHPDRLCYVIEDTFERVPVNEEDHRLDEEVKKQIEEMGFEKMLLETKANLVA